MSIESYKKITDSGEVLTFYRVKAEGINKYTGKRVQKKRAGISSKIVAQRIYQELWNKCKEERPNGLEFKTWYELRSKYLEFVRDEVRSEKNPNGFSPKTFSKKEGMSSHTKSWDSLHLSIITSQFVTEQLNQFERGGMNRTLTFEIQKEVKATFSYAVSLGLFPISPLEKLKKLKVPKKMKLAFTHEEVRKLLFEAKKQNHPFYFIWILSLFTGLRRSELDGLKWTDIDFNNRLAHIQRQNIPSEGEVLRLKDHEDRTIGLPEAIMPTILEFKKKAKTDYVIECDEPSWINGSQAEVLGDFCEKIGIKRIKHHDLRATFITLALADGIPTGIVKENVGHAKLSTTDGYYRRSGIQMKGRIDALNIEIPDQVDEKRSKYQLKAL